jgi:hypothetical protein
VTAMTRTILLAAALLSVVIPIHSQERAAFPLDGKFYSELSRTPAVLRDGAWSSRLNTVVMARGIITAVDTVKRFKKHYRVVLTDREAERVSLRIIYHLYIEDTNTVSMMKDNEILEFSGQVIAYTPLTSRRDAYIVDILFEKGATIIE